MAGNFSQKLVYEGKNLLAVVVPQLRQDGMYYEVNINGFPRFMMRWSELDRYDLVPDEDVSVPYGLVLAVSDVIESRVTRRKKK
jgi:hypothetical protein